MLNIFINNKKTITAVLVAALILALALAGYFSNLYAYGVWRYEMTIKVETPEGVKTGSAIRQGSNFSVIKIYENLPYYQGEAVVVDLGERGLLYALRAGPPRRRESTLTTVEQIREANRILFDVKTIVQEKEYPTIVSVRDLKDLKSVVLVKGWQYNFDEEKYYYEDNMEEVFGKGVRIKEITVERTRKPLTNKIAPYLPDNYTELASNEGWNSLTEKEQQRMERLMFLIRK